MGSLSLKCPFCCDEKFSSHLSLKYHILSLIDNILCPACNCRFDNIFELTEHLGRACKEKQHESSDIEMYTVNTDMENILDNPQEIAKDAQNDDNQSILAEALLKDNSNENENDPPSYLCQMCNMQFESVEEHLQQYHKGEEVILETAEEASVRVEELKTEPEEYNIFQMHEDDLEVDSGYEIIEEGDFIDNEGRAYTRKVVKIGKFWQDNADTPPMKEKYIVENGKVRKIENEEEQTIDNKESIIEIHRCPKCYLQFPKLDHYIKHTCDPTKIKFRCIYCSSVFQNYQSLTTHLNSHLLKDEDGTMKRIVTIGPYTCDICKTMFPSYKSLRLHQRMHEPVKEKAPEAPVKYSITGIVDDEEHTVRDMFICSICNNTYDKEYEEVHMKSHSVEENYNCTICNRKFFTKENLEMHAKAHSNIKKFVCSYCKKPFSTFDSLQEHISNQCQKRPYECRYCGRRFSRPHEKVKHERIHTGEKPHVCQICGKTFRVSYCLTLHMRTHSGTRPYQCNHCGKRFKSHSVYNHHLLTHSDVRAYKCPFCPKAFKTAVQLAGHKNSHIKPFACTECNRPFASLYAVRAHMETHKRDNNLKHGCWLCGATYARAFALRDHMKEHNMNAVQEANISADEIVLSELETAESTTQIEHEMNAEDVEHMILEENE